MDKNSKISLGEVERWGFKEPNDLQEYTWAEVLDDSSITDADEYCQVLAAAQQEVNKATGIVPNEIRMSPSELADLKKRFGEDIEAKIEAVGITVKTG